MHRRNRKFIPKIIRNPTEFDKIWQRWKCPNCGWIGCVNYGLSPSGHAKTPYCPKCKKSRMVFYPIIDER